jgi:hypothetical protein
MVSLYPSFGINGTFVGGNTAGGGLVITPTTVRLYGKFAARKMTDSKAPSDLIVFCSARARDDHGPQEGYFLVEPPYLTSRRWSEAYAEADAPELFGYVHPRNKGRAAVGLLDGHAELYDLDQLQDMRHWSPQATRADWTLGSE